MSKKTAIITGGSRGIGLAAALRFAQADHNIVIAARNEEQLEKAVEQIAAHNVECLAVTADVGDADEADNVVTSAVERFGSVDILVNNAGYVPQGSGVEISNEDFAECVSANINSVFYMTRSAWNELAKSGGIIINISSISSFDPFPKLSVYGSCKVWINMFTQSMAKQGRKDGIRIYAIAPGAVETQMLRGAFPDYPEAECLAPDDIAAVIEGLCDDRFAYSVGETIKVTL